ncbi:flavoprotein [Lucifera butyrica]|uniref:Flavoprotein n=2 Tax=Lucifera butyrica TaxID=1351585 RepID=A0A498RF01_9FIRM|nr:flavoprotein [Lucifera butyrica]
MSGASGIPIAVALLQEMQKRPDWETHLVITKGAQQTIEQETPLSVTEIEALATKCYALDDIGAGIASGTFWTEGMVVVPCSMKTVSGIANGFSQNLLLRAADVTLKEGRNLVLVARESPLSPIHLANLLTLARLGVRILPPMLTYYNKPASIDDMTRHVVGKITDVFQIETAGFQRWT